jgi:hypothetical protein
MAHARNITVIARPANPPEDARGVVYAEDVAAPGLKFFRCDTHRANLSQRGCAERWITAQNAKGHAAERFAACRGCPIGAAHAGEQPVRYSWLYGQAICPRCRRGGFRMISNRICVSCRNREYELARGYNGRGNKPTELMAKAPRYFEMKIEIDGVARRKRGHGVDLQEPMLQALRTTKGDLAFAFQGPSAMLRQGRLF